MELNRFKQLLESSLGDVKPLVNEALGGGFNTTEKPAEMSLDIKTFNLKGDDLFPTGSAEINTNSQSFKNALYDLKNLPSNKIVTVQGGASAVGAKRGFNNQALADKRASNFVELMKKNGSKAQFKILPGVVGSSEVKDSSEARKEQFVKYSFDTTGYVAKNTTAIDNTATVIPDEVFFPPKLKRVTDNTYGVKFEVVYDPKVISSKTIRKQIEDALSGKVIQIKNLKY